MISTDDVYVVRMNSVFDVFLLRVEVMLILLSIFFGNRTKQLRRVRHEMIENHAVVRLSVFLKVIQTTDQCTTTTAIDELSPDQRWGMFTRLPLMLLAGGFHPMIPFLDWKASFNNFFNLISSSLWRRSAICGWKSEANSVVDNLRVVQLWRNVDNWLSLECFLDEN